MTPTVLLVVGMQNDKCSRCPSDLVTRVNTCILAARSRQWSVIFALDLHHPRHVSFQHEPPHCVLQTVGASMVSGLLYGFAGSDLVVRGVDPDEDSNDAFFFSQPSHSYSRLRDLLCTQSSSRDYARLCLCGASPDGCLEQTTLTASTRGYCRGDPIIISDASWCLPRGSTTSLVRKPLETLLTLWDD